MITLTEIRKLEEKVTSCLVSGKCAISEESRDIQVEMYRKPTKHEAGAQEETGGIGERHKALESLAC